MSRVLSRHLFYFIEGGIPPTAVTRRIRPGRRRRVNRSSKRPIDQLFEYVERNGPFELSAVDEKSRRAPDAQRQAVR